MGIADVIQCSEIHKFKTDDGSESIDYVDKDGNSVFKIKSNGIESSTELTKEIAKHDIFRNINAEATAGVHAAITGTGAENVVDTGITQPDVPRNVSITVTNVTTPSGDVKIEGLDAKGETLEEDITIVPGSTAYSENAFSMVTQITVPAGVTADDTVEVGIGSKLGLTSDIETAGKVYKVRKNDDDFAIANWTADPDYGTVDVSDVTAIVADDDFEVWYKTSLEISMV